MGNADYWPPSQKINNAGLLVSHRNALANKAKGVKLSRIPNFFAIPLFFLSAQAIAQEVSSTAAPTVNAVSPEGLQIGVDTIETTKAKLGKPFSVAANSDGTTVLIYHKTKTHVKGATFIPLVGMFAGGATANTTVRSFTFGANEVLKSFSTTDSSVDCHTKLTGVNCQ